MLAASTCTSTVSGPTFGSSTSRTSRSSGLPYSSSATARIAPPPAPGRAPSRPPATLPHAGRPRDRAQPGKDPAMPDTPPAPGSYVNPTGDFTRDARYIATRITADGRDGYPVEPGRYRLVVSRACPWANRSIIVRRLLGLEDVLSMGVAGPTHDARSWTFDLDPGGRDPVLGIERLQEAFYKRVPDYPKGITVPAIVDIPSGAVVTNDYPQLTLDLSTEWRDHHRPGAPDL